MPIRKYRRRPIVRRRKYVRRRYIRKRKGALVTKRRGFMMINRMGPDLHINNSIVQGVPQIAGSNIDQNLQLGTVTSTPGWGYYVPFTMTFSANQLQNIAEIQPLFDQYKIYKVVIKITYQHNVSTASGTSGMPELRYRVDYDDNNVIGPGAFKELMGFRIKTFTSNRNYHYIVITKPRSQLLQNDYSASTLSAKVPVNRWLDTDVLDVQHFGLKGVLSNVLLPASSDVATSFKFETRYYLGLANVR